MILSGIKVEAYGTSTALNNVAQVSVRDGRNLVVNVFDESTSNAVERAIRSAGLNLNPVRDGPAKLRVPVPKQSQKTRETLIKVGRFYVFRSQSLVFVLLEWLTLLGPRLFSVVFRTGRWHSVMQNRQRLQPVWLDGKPWMQ